MRNLLITAILILLSHHASASTFGIGFTGGYNLDPNNGELQDIYSLHTQSYQASLDFYGDISIGKSKSTFTNLLSEVLTPLNYRLSLNVNPVMISGYYNLGWDNFDTSLFVISPEISATFLYNIFDIHGYFIDAGLGLNYKLQNIEAKSVASYNDNYLDFELENNFYFSYELGIGKSYKNWATRLFYRSAIVTQYYKVYNSTNTQLNSYSITNPSSINLSLIFWW